MTVDELLADYQATTELLRDAYQGRANALAAELTTRGQAYAHLSANTDLNITAIREQSDHAAHIWKAEAIKIAGVIDAHLAHLRWLDVKHAHLTHTV